MWDNILKVSELVVRNGDGNLPSSDENGTAWVTIHKNPPMKRLSIVYLVR